MTKWIQRRKYKLPKHHKDVWYNQTIHMSDRKYPIVFDNKKNYVMPEVGNCVIMAHLEDGRAVYYRITKIKRIKGSDWLYDTDCFECDMVFDSIIPQGGGTKL